MLKYKPLFSLLENAVGADSQILVDPPMPKTLAISILSSKNGSPLLSSIAVDTPFQINMAWDQLHPLYESYLEQFTEISFAKVRDHMAAESEALDDAQDITQTTQNYGSITEEPNYNNKMDYTSTSAPLAPMSLKTHTISDLRTHLNFLAHYIFFCYKAFKKDYALYKSQEEHEKSKKKQKKKAEDEMKAYESLDPEDKIQDSRWFCLDVEQKRVFLYVIQSTKTAEQFYLMLVTELRYPKGLAKLKLELIEKGMKERGF